MMEKFKILIKQNMYRNQNGEIINEYHFATVTGIYLGVIRFPGDGQFIFDDKVLSIICKAFGARWGFIKIKG